MEENNIKIKFKIAAIMFILNTFSNDIIKHLIEIFDIKTNNKENKKDNINIILDFLKTQKEKDIDEFNIILKQVGPANINQEENNFHNYIEHEEKNKTNIFGAPILTEKECTHENENNNIVIKNINYNKNIKKRTYMEMINNLKEKNNMLNYPSINEINEEENKMIPNEKKSRNNNRKFLQRFLKDNIDNHYYYQDNNGKEWEFLEIQGSNNNYYFKCSTSICRGFGMIQRSDKKSIFNLTKLHSIDYYNHSYYINKIIPKDLLKGKITKDIWKKERNRYILFKWYFNNFKNETEENCKLYFKDKLHNIFRINDDVNKEISKCKNSINYTNNSFNTILSKLENLKDKNDQNISYKIEYEHINKFTNKTDKLFMFIIINKNMCVEIKNPNIYQFFGDSTFRCVPPTFRNFKLYIISGFNLNIKRARLLVYALIPNETERTFSVLFENLKEKFGFNPKLYTSDFQKSSTKALKKIFPNIYLIKCFFHFTQCIFKHIKKLGLSKKKFQKDIQEILFNIKMLCFIEPKNIYYIYKKIKNKYNNNNFKDFFSYFEKNWKPNCQYKKLKIIPEWNYFNLLNSIEIDKKYLYITNNIAEHLNKILNSKLNTKYPNFDNWKNAILSTEIDVNNKNDIIERENFISKLILFFIKMNKDNKLKKDLLTLEEIKALTSISIEGSSIGSYIPISKFFDFNNNEENEIIINNDNNEEKFGGASSSSSNNSESENSLNLDDGESIVNENDVNLNNTSLLNSLDEETDLCYNIQQILNAFSLDLD